MFQTTEFVIIDVYADGSVLKLVKRTPDLERVIAAYIEADNQASETGYATVAPFGVWLRRAGIDVIPAEVIALD